jgi:hypothetical protein
MKRAQLACLAVFSLGLMLLFESCSSCSHTPVASGPAATTNRPAGNSPTGGGPIGSTPSQFYTPPGAVYQVTYTPNTVRIDLAAVQKSLRSVSSDAQVFLFDDTDPRIRELTAGKVMFLEHIGVRRVTGAVEQGSQIAVVTDDASLTDFIQDGRIEFKMPVNFRRSAAMAPPPNPREMLFAGLRGWLEAPETVYAAGDSNSGSIGLHAKGEIDNWEFELSGKPEGDGFKLELEAGKKLAGLTAQVKAEGELSHIVTAFKAVVQGGKLEDFDYNTPLQGNVHITWGALTTGENSGIGEARLKLPPFAKDIIDVYGLPLLFRIDEALIFKPGFGTKKDAAEGGFTLTYDGTGGLSIHSGNSTPEGSMTAEPKLEKTTAESLAAHGIVLAVDAPKISVSLGTESITEAIQEAVPGAILDKAANALESLGLGGLIKTAKKEFFKINGEAYVQLVTEFDYAGSGPLSLVPCTMTHLNFYAQAGAGAELLGIKGESPKKNISETKLTFRNPDIDACGPK